MATPDSTYPANCSVEYPESSSRIWALLGFLFWIKVIALIPHIIILEILSIVSWIILTIGYLVVIFTGKYPRALFDFMLGVGIWNYRVNCWIVGLTDKYPPFSLI